VSGTATSGGFINLSSGAAPIDETVFALAHTLQSCFPSHLVGRFWLLLFPGSELPLVSLALHRHLRGQQDRILVTIFIVDRLFWLFSSSKTCGAISDSLKKRLDELYFTVNDPDALYDIC
jgi:hypothetical protein